MIEIPLVGQINEMLLVMGGLSTLIGFIVGSQLKSAIKIAVVLVVGALAVGLITPAVMAQLVEVIAALKPMYSDYFNQGNMGVATVSFLVGMAVGLWKG